MENADVCSDIITAMGMIEKEQVNHDELGVQERVFCYELYHQLRMLQRSSRHKYQGELNKIGQNHTPRCRANPDFLFHTPGSNKDNNTVIEVKLAKTSPCKLDRDLSKLAWFMSSSGYSYKTGVFIIIGSTKCLDNRKKRFSSIPKEETGVPIKVLMFDCDEWKVREPITMLVTQSLWENSIKKHSNGT